MWAISPLVSDPITSLNSNTDAGAAIEKSARSQPNPAATGICKTPKLARIEKP